MKHSRDKYHQELHERLPQLAVRALQSKQKLEDKSRQQRWYVAMAGGDAELGTALMQVHGRKASGANEVISLCAVKCFALCCAERPPLHSHDPNVSRWTWCRPDGVYPG